MSTDPIKMVKDILAPKSTATKTTGSTSAASTTATSATGSTSSADAYKLSQSLLKLMSQDSGDTTTQDMSNYTAKGLKDYFQSAYDVRSKEKAAAAAAPKPLDEVLKASQAKGTNEPTLSAAALAIVNDKKSTATDTGLAAVDQRLAQTVGISRTIGTA
mgnify:FL=1